MGVTLLKKLLSAHGETVDLKMFRGQRIAVDSSCIFRPMFRVPEVVEEYMDQCYDHLCALFLAWLTKLETLAGVIVIVVWDGKPLPGKQYTKKRRMDDINEAKHQLESYLEQTHDGYSGTEYYLFTFVMECHFYSMFTLSVIF